MHTRPGRLSLIVALALLLPSIPLALFPSPTVAQQAEPLQITVQAVDSARFPRVSAYVTVADSRGIPIDGLTAGAFTLSEDGQPVPENRVVVSPSERPDRPISLVLALDISNSLGEAGVAGVRSAALAMLDNLPPQAGDRIALLSFGNANERSITVEQDFTNDRARLRDIVSKLSIGPENAYTAFWGAAHEALALLEADPQAAASRRRAVIILTDGVDNSAAGAQFLPENTQRTPEEVIAYAQRLGVPIYPISFGDQTDVAALEQLAAATQGVSYISATPRDLELAFADVLAALRKEYRVDFTSALPADDTAHTLEVRVAYQGFTASAQTTFTATAHPVQVRLNLEDGEQVSGNVLIQPAVDAYAPIAYARLSVNGAPLQEFGAGDIRYTWSTAQLAPGAYALDLFVRDNAGNTGAAQVTVNVVEPLRVRITSPAPGARLAGAVDVTFEIENNVAEVNTVTLLADGREVAALAAPDSDAYSFTWDAAAAGLGGHQLEVVVRDTVGNQASASVVVNVAPVLTVRIAAPLPNADVSGEVAFAYTVDAVVAPLRSVVLLVDGTPYAMTSVSAGLFWNADLAPLGRHTLAVRVLDEAGNTATDSVTVNVSRPVGVEITAPVEGAKVAGAVEVAFTLTGRPSDVADVQFFVGDLELDDATADLALQPGANTLTWDAGAVGLGLRRLEIRLTDTLGNTDADATFVNVVEPLVVHVISPAPGAEVDGEVSVAYAVEANAALLATVGLRVDGAPYARSEDAAGAFTWDAGAAALGAHTLEVVASDKANNEARAAVPVTVTRPLSVVIDTPAQGARVAGQVLVRFTVAGNPADVARAEFWVEGRRIAAISDLRAGANALTWDAEATGVGLRQLEIRLTDTTGAPHHAATVVNVVEPLKVQVTSPAPGAQLDAAAGTVEVAYEVEANAGYIRRVALLVDGAEVAASLALDPAGALTWDPGVAALGAHTLTVAVTDSNDYRATDSVSVTLTRALSVEIGLEPGGRVAGASVEVPFTLNGNPVDVDRAAFFVDDRRVTTLTGLRAGANTLTWDATAVGLGPHTLEVRLTDTLGNEITSSVTVNVVEPLTAQITAPAPNVAVSGVVDVAYAVTVNAGSLARVALRVDDVEINAAEGEATEGTLQWDTGAFALGAHTLEIVVANDAGNEARASMTVNVTRLLRVAIVQPEPGAPVAGPVEVRFSLEGQPSDVSRAAFYVDDRRVQTLAGLRAGENALAWDAGTVGLGPHTLEVRLTDTLGNELTSTVTVNVVEPLAVRITSPAPNAVLRGPVEVTYAVEARAAALYDVALRADGVEVAAAEELAPEGALVWNSDAAALGAHTLEVVAVDQAGKEGRASVTVNVSRPLLVAIQEPASGAQVAGEIEVRYALDGFPSDVARAAFYVDDRRVTTLAGLRAGVNTVLWDAEAAGLGSHTLEVRLTDTLGKEINSAVTVNVIPPLEAAILAPVPDAEVAGSVAVRYRAKANAAALARVALLVDGVEVAAADAPEVEGALTWDASAAGLGVHRLQIVAEDADGRTLSTEMSVTAVEPITLEILAPVQDEEVAGVVAVRFDVETVAAALARVALLVDGVEVAAAAAEDDSLVWDTTTLAPGVHRVEVRAEDAAGFSAAQTVNVRVLKPVLVRVLAPEPGARVAGHVDVRFSVESNAAALDRVTLLVDNEVIAALEEPQAIDAFTWDASPLDLGAHQLTVRAEDTAGNIGESGLTVTVAEPLTVDLTEPASGAQVTGLVSVRYRVAITGALLETVALKVDGEAVETLASPAGEGAIPWDTGGLRLGEHQIEVEARDSAGNVQRAGTKVVVTRPLSVAIVAPEADALVSGEVRVYYETNAALGEIAGAALLVNDQEVASVRGPLNEAAFTWDTTDLGAGLFTLAVTVRDVTGQAQTSAPVTVQVIFQGNSLPIFLLIVLLIVILAVVVPLTLRRRRQLMAQAASGAAVAGTGVVVAPAGEREIKAYLVAESGPTSGTRWLLAQSETIVGRSRTRADVVVTGRSASRQHARISRRGDTFIYQDLKPEENPSLVNGAPLTGPVPLQEGDVIEVGDTRLRFTREA